MFQFSSGTRTNAILEVKNFLNFGIRSGDQWHLGVVFLHIDEFVMSRSLSNATFALMSLDGRNVWNTSRSGATLFVKYFPNEDITAAAGLEKD